MIHFRFERHNGGRTRTDLGLEEAIKMFLKSKRNLPKWLIVVTDGESSGGIRSLREPIKKLKDLGAKVVAIGVGHPILTRELMEMATDHHHVIKVRRDKDVPKSAEKFFKLMCSSKQSFAMILLSLIFCFVKVKGVCNHRYWIGGAAKLM